MVTIPQGNYDNQKIIIGKQVTNDNTPMVYKSPLQNMVNLTNNIIPDNSNLKVEMWANHPDDYAWPDDVLFSESSVYTTTIAENNLKLKYCIWDSNDTNMQCFYQKYDILGLSAQFSTWLNEYNTISGNYGLMLEITFKDLNTNENFAKAYSCQLDSDDFFGDVYNFETYYTQEKTFDLSDYKDSAITRLRLFAYQRRNFVTLDGEYVPYADPDEFSDIPPNIYIKDFMIALGTYNNEVSEDTAEIMTDSSMTYDKNFQGNSSEYDPVWVTNYLLSHQELLSLNTELVIYGLTQLLNQYNSGTIIKIEHKAKLIRLLQNYDYEDIYPNIENNLIVPIINEQNRETNNLKYINLRWVHIFDENNIKVVQENEIPKDYEIRWYRYLPGAPSPDQFAGAHWVYLTDQLAAAGASVEVMLNKINVEFQPDVNKNEEKIKAIIIKKENGKEYKVVVSNILEFNNNTEIRNTVTFEDISALSLKAEDNFNGNFFLYNRSGELGKNEWNTRYCIKAYFKDAPLSTEDCSLVHWDIPTQNTMIKSAEPRGAKDSQIFYYIKDTLNNTATNNTISLRINKDGLEYIASIALRFGTAGTNGSNYTMSLSWQKNKKAINVDPIGQEADELKGTLWVYDQNGVFVDISSATIFAKWKVAANCDLLKGDQSGTNNYVFEEENEDIYYPVVFYNIGNRSMYRLMGPYFSDWQKNKRRQPVEDQVSSHGFYYFADANADDDDYYYYDLEDNKFKKWDNNQYENTDIAFLGPVYRKKRENESRKKVEFQQIDLSETQYGWNKNRRYFIKYNNQYIIDPWDKYIETETYYEPILQAPIIRDDLNSNNKLTIDVSGQEITISYDINNKPPINSIYILEVTLNNFGDYPLVAYYPIALTKTAHWTINNNTVSKEVNVDYIEGPKEVRYATTGETDYNKNPYKIYMTQLATSQNESTITHYIHDYSGENYESNIPTGYENWSTGYWRLLVAANYNEWDPSKSDNQFNPSLEETTYITVNNKKQKLPEQTNIFHTPFYDTSDTTKQGWLVYHNPILKPPAIYYKDAAAYAVQFVTNTNILWTQPIFVYQDNYPSTTLNQWNGKDIITDENSGVMVANGFAAGHKNIDNTFSGVVLGDWSKTDNDRSFAVQETGVYGFNHGAMSYALKDDGTAFFGKDGRGRIYIDGNNATIKSAAWRYDNPLGMMLDLDDGILKANSSDYNLTLSPGTLKIFPQNSNGNTISLDTSNNNSLFEIKSGNHSLINIGNNNYYLRSYDFNTDPNLGPEDGTQINLSNGEITSYKLNLKGYKSVTPPTGDPYFNTVVLKTSNNTSPFAIGKDGHWNFKVDWDGTLHAEGAQIRGVINAQAGGTIAGWNIKDGSLYKGNGAYGVGIQTAIETNSVDKIDDKYYLNPLYAFWVYRNKGGSHPEEGTTEPKYEHWETLFGVDYTGKMVAKNADISGKITATSGEIGGWKINSTTLRKDVIDDNETEHYWVRLISMPPGNGQNGTNYYKDAFGVFQRYNNGTAWTDKPILRILYDGTIIHGSDGNSNFKLDGSTGNITATGTITATSGKIGGWNINLFDSDHDYGSLYRTQSAGADSGNTGEVQFGGKNYAIYVNNGQFSVKYNGDMVAQNGTFTGEISNGNFTVTTAGYLTAKSGKIGGITISNSTLSASTTNGASFTLNSNGALTATSATITGDIKANNYYMKENTNYTQFFTHTMPIITEFKCTSDGTLISVKATTVKVVCAGAVGNAYQIYPRPAGGGCFVAGTKITMANGIYQNIENIKENDLVLVYDENNNKFVIDKVIKLLIHHNTNQLMTLILEDGTKIKSTLSHPFLTINGWKTIDLKMAFKEHSILCQKIKIGDILIGQKHNAKIIDIKYEQCPMNYDTYNIFIKKYHTYIANNYVVHNSWTINKD